MISEILRTTIDSQLTPKEKLLEMFWGTNVVTNETFLGDDCEPPF